MLVFATSDKGGTGRSVTSGNLAYRHALQGFDSCYVDFDFGSPTSGAIFDLPEALAGVEQGGLHGYLVGGGPDPRQINVWAESQREALRGRPPGTGRLTLVPGDVGGSEFSSGPGIVDRCARLFQRLDEEYDLILVDLSAGRSYATEIVLAATALPALRDVPVRWLVFHRWTRQHIVAAGGLVHGRHGILETGVGLGHDRAGLTSAIRYVRTAVLDPSAPDQAGLRPEQLAWLDVCNRRLQELASRKGVGRLNMIGEVPLDPVLQWQEQLISNDDVWLHRTANERTVAAFEELSKKIVDETAWVGL
ncbi:SCO2523 family variant P-loop protein [Actinoplanes derwentensis]|uniref:CobQ/CobB/MinD/ParA nucleotide binding domain-containing protein n=1 Tax=Actinoplanes derwentensis TaxID=113562 RepID=A0A1H1SL03_9ACTN|nr:SCO2523 family variant P-loop protein [Actinoplanes derwentensis]GID83273.1 DNA-binding protein [Actinoplanes derwentensis]SDS48704.1 CobQ/CobB/MinD/ParA nucleotide binding domain-containing protein [Actinoplanes derwentensis]